MATNQRLLGGYVRLQAPNRALATKRIVRMFQQSRYLLPHPITEEEDHRLSLRGKTKINKTQVISHDGQPAGRSELVSISRARRLSIGD